MQSSVTTLSQVESGVKPQAGRVRRDPRPVFYLKTGQVVRPVAMPKPVREPLARVHNRVIPGVSNADVDFAFVGRLSGVPVSQTVIPFGPFNGLMVSTIAGLKRGQVVGRFRQPVDAFAQVVKTLCFTSLAQYDRWVADAADSDVEPVPLVQPKDGSEPLWLTVVGDDTEGVRYLDRLRSEPWLYPETATRLALYLSHPNVRPALAAAFSSRRASGHGPDQELDGAEFDRLMFPAYGDGDDGSLRPQEFEISALYDTSADRWCQDKAFLAPLRGDRQSRTDDDPTPAGWQLDDPTRLERGYTEPDAWVDMKEPAFNDLERDWLPPATDWRAQKDTPHGTPARLARKPVVVGSAGEDPARWETATVVAPRGKGSADRPDFSPDAWRIAMRYLTLLERVGNAEERTLRDYAARTARWVRLAAQHRADEERPCEWHDRLARLTADLKRELGVVTASGFQWREGLPPQLRAELTRAVAAAKERLAQRRQEEGLDADPDLRADVERVADTLSEMHYPASVVWEHDGLRTTATIHFEAWHGDGEPEYGTCQVFRAGTGTIQHRWSHGRPRRKNRKPLAEPAAPEPAVA